MMLLPGPSACAVSWCPMATGTMRFAAKSSSAADSGEVSQQPHQGGESGAYDMASIQSVLSDASLQQALR